MTDTVTPFAEFGPVWIMVGILFTALAAVVAYVGRRLLEQTGEVTSEQVATLRSARAEMENIRNDGAHTADACEQANKKLDAHNRLFDNGMSLIRSVVPPENVEAHRHIDQMEAQLRNDIARIKS